MNNALIYQVKFSKIATIHGSDCEEHENIKWESPKQEKILTTSNFMG